MISSFVSALLATLIQFLPVMSTRFGSAPSLMRVLTQTWLSACAAMCSGVAKLKSVQFRLHPPLASATMDSSTWSVDPIWGSALITTQCSGLNPPLRSEAFTSAPLSISAWMTPSLACMAAWWSAVILFSSVIFASTPLSTNCWTVSTSPLAAAWKSSLWSSAMRNSCSKRARCDALLWGSWSQLRLRALDFCFRRLADLLTEFLRLRLVSQATRRVATAAERLQTFFW